MTGYDVNSCFQSAVKCNWIKINAQKAHDCHDFYRFEFSQETAFITSFVRLRLRHSPLKKFAHCMLTRWLVDRCCCPDISSYDFSNHAQLRTINYFIITHTTSPRINIIFCRVNLDEKCKCAIKQCKQTSPCLPNLSLLWMAFLPIAKAFCQM